MNKQIWLYFAMSGLRTHWKWFLCHFSFNLESLCSPPLVAGPSSGAGHYQPEASAGEADRHHSPWKNALVPWENFSGWIWANCPDRFKDKWKIFVSIVSFSLHLILPGLLGQPGVTWTFHYWTHTTAGSGHTLSLGTPCYWPAIRQFQSKLLLVIQHSFCLVWVQSEHTSWALRDIIEG